MVVAEVEGDVFVTVAGASPGLILSGVFPGLDTPAGGFTN